MKPKPIIKELSLLAFLLVAVIVGFWVATSINSSNSSFDIELHDIYFSFSVRVIFMPFFLLLVTLVYLIKEAFHGYRRMFQNFVLLISLVLINLYLLFIAKFAGITTSFKPGWTIYPPLSALPKAVPGSILTPSPIFKNMWEIVLSAQIFFLLLLVIIAVITGKNWNPNKSEN